MHNVIYELSIISMSMKMIDITTLEVVFSGNEN